MKSISPRVESTPEYVNSLDLSFLMFQDRKKLQALALTTKNLNVQEFHFTPQHSSGLAHAFTHKLNLIPSLSSGTTNTMFNQSLLSCRFISVSYIAFVYELSVARSLIRKKQLGMLEPNMTWHEMMMLQT